MVDLAFSEEQEALRSAFAGLFAKHASPERVRAAEPLGFDERLWRELVATGVPTMALPEEAGGGGASTLDVAVIAYELGRHIAPAPLIETVVATTVLHAVGGQDELFEQVAEGMVIPTIALSESRDGTVRNAPAGAVADAIVALSGDRLLLARRDGKRPFAAPTANLADAPIADWHLGDDVHVLCDGDRARDLYADAVANWRVLSAAALSGLGSAALDIGVEYVKQRHAFGVPVGWFQAVQHRLADVTVAFDGAELLTWEAAWARSTRDSRAQALATMAFLHAADTAFQICRASLQFHGGYGYSLEYDIQLFFRRAKAWPLIAGSPRVLYQQLAGMLYDTGEEA